MVRQLNYPSLCFHLDQKRRKEQKKRAYSFLSAEHTGARKEKLKMGGARPGGGRIDKNIYTLFCEILNKMSPYAYGCREAQNFFDQTDFPIRDCKLINVNIP